MTSSRLKLHWWSHPPSRKVCDSDGTSFSKDRYIVGSSIRSDDIHEPSLGCSRLLLSFGSLMPLEAVADKKNESHADTKATCAYRHSITHLYSIFPFSLS